MSTSDSKHFVLKIEVAYEYRFLLKVSLFDSALRVISPVEESYNALIFHVTKGLYSLRIEMNAQIKDEIITVTADDHYVIDGERANSHLKIIEPPLQYSSAVLKGESAKRYESSHDYYIDPAVEFSQKDTFSFDFSGSEETYSSLFVFLRFPSKEKFESLKDNWSESFYEDFEIVNEYGECLLDFESGKGIEIDKTVGYVAFSANVPNGIYYLIYRGDESRQIPIYVFKHWHTQFFMTLGKEPLYGTTRIFVSQDREFNPYEDTNKYIDILLNKLQNRDYSVDQRLIEITANGKYVNPMLGLICSYVYLKSSQTENDELFKTILRNLQNVILRENIESPDLRALEILAANHFGTSEFERSPVYGTPMLRIGFEAIQGAALKNKELISKNSVNDFVSELMYYDSPFNTFKPIPIYEINLDASDLIKKLKDLESNRPISRNPFLGMIDVNEIKAGNKSIPLPGNSSEPEADEFSIDIEKLLKPSLVKFITDTDESSNVESGWVKNSIAELMKTNDNLSIDDISNELNLSGNTITRIFDTWEEDLDKEKDG